MLFFVIDTLHKFSYTPQLIFYQAGGTGNSHMWEAAVTLFRRITYPIFGLFLIPTFGFSVEHKDLLLLGASKVEAIQLDHLGPIAPAPVVAPVEVQPVPQAAEPAVYDDDSSCCGCFGSKKKKQVVVRRVPRAIHNPRPQPLNNPQPLGSSRYGILISGAKFDGMDVLQNPILIQYGSELHEIQVLVKGIEDKLASFSSPEVPKPPFTLAEEIIISFDDAPVLSSGRTVNKGSLSLKLVTMQESGDRIEKGYLMNESGLQKFDIQLNRIFDPNGPSDAPIALPPASPSAPNANDDSAPPPLGI